MTPVTAKPKAQAASSRTKATPAAAAPQSNKRLFVSVAELLRQAWLAAAPHDYSGESDRLLRVAAVLADIAPEDEPPGQGQNRAFDIAACINAARLVPGDTESAERSAYLAQVGVILAEIADTTPNDILRTNVPRPRLPDQNRVATDRKAPKITSSEASELHFDAMRHFGCAKYVLDLYAEHAGSAHIYGMRDLLGFYYAQADEKADSPEAGDFANGILPDLSCSLENLMSVIGFANGEGGMDDGLVHAVEYLLRDAKAIADGERGSYA